MDHKFKDLTVIRPGASNGDGTVIRIDLINGTEIYAVSVAREGFSYTVLHGLIYLRMRGLL